MITYVAPRGESDTVTNYLDDRGRPLGDRLRIVTYDDLETRSSLEDGLWIFSGVDRLTQSQRALADLAWATLDASGMSVRLLNHPSSVLLRAPLLERLHREGINRFKAVPPEGRDDDLTYPVFVRERNAHTGSLTALLPDRRALDTALGHLAFRGFRPSDLLVVEFLDTSDKDGLYRKYSSYYVAGTVVPRAIRFGRQWMLKARHSFWDESKVREQQEWFDRNGFAEQVAAVFRLADIDYGRMDYAVVDGRIQVWEINTNPTLGRGTSNDKPPAMKALKEKRAPVHRGFDTMFQAALRSLDCGSEDRRSTPFRPPPELLAAIAAERAAAERQHRKREWRGVLVRRLAALQPGRFFGIGGLLRRVSSLAQ